MDDIHSLSVPIQRPHYSSLFLPPRLIEYWIPQHELQVYLLILPGIKGPDNLPVDPGLMWLCLTVRLSQKQAKGSQQSRWALPRTCTKLLLVQEPSKPSEARQKAEHEPGTMVRINLGKWDVLLISENTFSYPCLIHSITFMALWILLWRYHLYTLFQLRDLTQAEDQDTKQIKTSCFSLYTARWRGISNNLPTTYRPQAGHKVTYPVACLSR